MRNQSDTHRWPSDAEAWREAGDGQVDWPADAQAPPSTPAADRSEGLRVLLMPDATGGNPYQRQLTHALERLGARVTLAQPGGALPLLGAVAAHRSVHVLHLHWTHRLVIGRTRARTVFKAARFLAELALLRLLGVRLVWTAHNLLEHERRHPRLELLCGRLAARLYDCTIVHCGAARRAVAAAYRLPPHRQAKLHAIPHGHFIGVYPDTVSRDQARDQLGLTGAGPVFVHFGQIRGYKGVDELLDAFAALEAPTARLVIAGKPWDGAMAADLENRARRDPRIRLFLGFVPDAEVQVYMKAADAVVLPYRDILTSGNAMLAMSFGRAVVMPRCGCAEQMLGERGGMLYRPSEPRALERALGAALGADFEAMGARNRRRALEFDWSRIAERTLAAYRPRAAS